MPLQNRVDPFSCLHAVPERGVWMGNRGILHDDNRQIVTPRWKTPLWIICTTDILPGWSARTPMTPGTYTELFFLDEVTALAAGHRPCALCRHEAWMSYCGAIADAEKRDDMPKAPEINTRLKGEMRVYLKRYGAVPRPAVAVADLPDGAMYAVNDKAFLKWRGAAHPWHFSGYGAPQALPRTAVRLTPQLNCLALAGGYQPQIDRSLEAAA